MSDNNEHINPKNHDYLDEYLKRAMEPDSPLSSTDNANQDSTSKTGNSDTTKPLSVTEPKVEESTSSKKSNVKSDEAVPKLKKKRGWYTILGITVLIVGFSIGYVRFKNAVMKKVLIEGNFYTSEDAILKRAKVPSNVSPDSVDLYAIIKRVESLPFVKEASVSILPPSQIKIVITERVPLALLLDGSKKALVDVDGVLMPQLFDKTPNVPLLYGFNVTEINDTLSSKSFLSVSDFLVSLKNRPLSNATISEVAWSKEDGIVALSSEDGVKLIFGKTLADSRMQSWEAFYSQIVPSVGLATVNEVDLRYKGQVITR